MTSMLDFLKFFKSLVRTETVHTDNCIFKLHYRFTVIILIICSILITSKQYFGDPIDCDMESDSRDVFDTYCWIYSTYIVKKTLGDNILPGLGLHTNTKFYSQSVQPSSPWKDVFKKPNEDEEIIYQKYYQWVCIILCLQALMFYLPRYVWKTWEAGRLGLLAKDLGGPILTPSWNHEAKEKLINYLLCAKYSHNLYAIRFFICETLNLVNVVLQILLMNWFLNSHFSSFGIFFEVLNGTNPMARMFPKLTKCMYYKYGPSGTIESRDGLCILPLNIFNEKMYLFLWFWFYFLLIISTLALLYRIVFFCVPVVRVYLLMAHAKYVTKKKAKIIVRRLSFGDYFMLYQLGKNLNPIIYKELVTTLGSILQSRKSSFNVEVTLPI